jgi:hypothetical protein
VTKKQDLVLSLPPEQLARVEAYGRAYGFTWAEAAAKLLDLSLNRHDTLQRDKQKQKSDRLERDTLCTLCEEAYPRKELSRELAGMLCAGCVAQLRASEAARQEAKAQERAVKLAQRSKAQRADTRPTWLCKGCQTPFRAAAGEDCNTCPACAAKTAPATRQQLPAPDPGSWQKRGSR